MDEVAQLYIDDARDKMVKSVEHLKNELIKLRAGKANPHILDGITVDYYGVNTPLNQVANINTPDPKTITVQPWEKNMVEPIEKAILYANIGVTPVNNGELIRINIPPLTEERRKLLVKQVRNEGENAKISIRNTRRETNEEIKKLQKDGLPEDEAKKAEDEIQKMTDDYTKKISDIVEKKEEDIMTI